MNQDNDPREVLARIAALVKSSMEDGDEDRGKSVHSSHDHDHDDASCTECGDQDQGCVVKSLPQRLLVKAALAARTINPVNAPSLAPLAAVSSSLQIADPLQIAVLTSKYWGPQLRRLTVSFMESTPSDLKARILSHMNAWQACCGISFVLTAGVGDVRISRQPGGYWSYLGTDVRLIPKNRQTMNLAGFTMSTSESEYKRVVRHETGHTLGFPHEHMRKAIVARIDPAKAYAWFLSRYGWNKATVDAQVLTPLGEASLMATPPDQTSIMCYQLPAAITKDNKPISGGVDINATDCRFAGTIYPKAGRAIVGEDAKEPSDVQTAQSDEWPESEDVEFFV
jgi:hypothetical protein